MSAGTKLLFVEPFLGNGFTSYTKNDGRKNPQMQRMAMAFSHFTYEESGGKRMVVDLQVRRLALSSSLSRNFYMS